MGWDTTDPTLHKFKQTLTPPTGQNFSGRTVKEEVAGSGTDTCKATYPQSPYAAATSITSPNHTWTVDSNQQWMWDYVGWRSVPPDPNVEPLGPVLYYRSVNAAPCYSSFPQRMVISCVSGGYVPYRDNVLRSDVGTTTVTSTRDGVDASKTWP